MGVYSDGSYGIQPGLIYSFPVTCEKGEWSIVQGLLPATLFRYFSELLSYFTVLHTKQVMGYHNSSDLKFHCFVKINCAVAGLKIDEFSRAKMDATAEELIEEKSLAYSCLN